MWSAYALVEYVLYSAIPLFTRAGAVFRPDGWKYNAILFDCYWLVGALSGALAGAIAAQCAMRSEAGRGFRPDLTRLPASLGLLTAVSVNLLTALPLGRSAVLLLLTSVGLSLGIVWALLKPGSRVVRVVEMHPTILAALVLGPTWLSTVALESAGLLWKGVAILSLVGALFGTNAFLGRWPSWTGTRHVASYLVCLTMLTAACALVSGAHRTRLQITSSTLPDPGRAPVIFFSLDTTRADHLSLYGYPRRTSPHLADFAKEATVYTDAMAASDMTLASHASIFTGMYPSWHGAHPYSVKPAVVRPLDGKFPTLAGILASKGYVTAGAAANSVFLTPKWGLSRGFQTFDVWNAVETLGFDRRFNLRHGIRRLLDCCMDTSGFDGVFRRSDEVNESALAILNQPAAHSRSLFLFVNYMDAHAPYGAPAPYNTMFLGSESALEYPQIKAVERELFEHGRQPSDSDRARIMAQYDGGIASEDAAFQQIIEALKENRMYEKAMIVVTGDHGEAFGDRGLLGHGVSVYQDQVHVPLVIKYPGQTQGSVVSQPVSHVDLLPTVLDTLGYAAPAQVQGRSLRDPASIGKREILAESFPNLFYAAWRAELDGTERAIRADSLKLVTNREGKSELFDLAKDAGEAHNLRALGHPGAQDLERALHRWVQQAPAAKSMADGKNQEELKRLKGLGYVQ